MPRAPEPVRRPHLSWLRCRSRSSQPVLACHAAKAEPERRMIAFAGHDFELDLEGIELELADLDFAASQ